MSGSYSFPISALPPFMSRPPLSTSSSSVISLLKLMNLHLLIIVTVYFMIHFWYIFYVFGWYIQIQRIMCDEMYPSCRVYSLPWNPLCYANSPISRYPWQPLIVLLSICSPFSGYHIFRTLQQVTFLDWFLSLSSMHLRSLSIFSMAW